MGRVRVVLLCCRRRCLSACMFVVELVAGAVAVFEVRVCGICMAITICMFECFAAKVLVSEPSEVEATIGVDGEGFSMFTYEEMTDENGTCLG